MSYVFPKMLAPLRDYLSEQGADVRSFVSARQAAYTAQQLIGSRVKFPPQGQDMVPTLLSIQKALEVLGRRLPAKSEKVQVKRRGGHRHQRGGQHRKVFTAEMFTTGIHIFCDGAAVPNPGLAGWGVAVYRDAVEIDQASGGDPEATNNQMELVALLNAVEKAKQLLKQNSDAVTIWCDSQYCVNGCNEWRHGWKAKGWQRGGDNAKPENRILLNADLWKAIDHELEEASSCGDVFIKWVKGHAGIAGNERADELAEIGRQLAADAAAEMADPLTAQFNDMMRN